MLIAAVLFGASAVGTAFPPSVEVLMLWRLIGGAGIGVASVVAPMYIAEIAPSQLRGRLGSLQQLAIVLGIFATGVTNYLIVQAAGSSTSEWLLGIEAWRWMFLIMLIPPAVYYLMALRIPESPRYLVEKGRLDEARTVLESVFTTDQSAKVLTIQSTMDSDHTLQHGRPSRPAIRAPADRVGRHPAVAPSSSSWASTPSSTTRTSSGSRSASARTRPSRPR